jgi:hypothetical protein
VCTAQATTEFTLAKSSLHETVRLPESVSIILNTLTRADCLHIHVVWAPNKDRRRAARTPGPLRFEARKETSMNHDTVASVAGAHAPVAKAGKVRLDRPDVQGNPKGGLLHG